MGWLDNMTVVHEVAKHLPEVRNIGELPAWDRQRPLVAVAFAVEM